MEKNEVFEVLEKELVGLAKDIRTIENMAFRIEEELNRIWNRAVKDVKTSIYIEIEHQGYPLTLTNERVNIWTWRYHSIYGRWLKHKLREKIYDINGIKEVSDWNREEFLDFIENFSDIVKSWLEEIRKVREQYHNKKVKEALEKLEKALEILSKSF